MSDALTREQVETYTLSMERGRRDELLIHDATLRQRCEVAEAGIVSLTEECADWHQRATALKKVIKERDYRDEANATETLKMLKDRAERIDDLKSQLAQMTQERDRWKEDHDYLRPHFDAAIDERNTLREANVSLIEVAKDLRGELVQLTQERDELKRLTLSPNEYLSIVSNREARIKKLEQENCTQREALQTASWLIEQALASAEGKEGG